MESIIVDGKHKMISVVFLEEYFVWAFFFFFPYRHIMISNSVIMGLLCVGLCLYLCLYVFLVLPILALFFFLFCPVVLFILLFMFRYLFSKRKKKVGGRVGRI